MATGDGPTWRSIFLSKDVGLSVLEELIVDEDADLEWVDSDVIDTLMSRAVEGLAVSKLLWFFAQKSHLRPLIRTAIKTHPSVVVRSLGRDIFAVQMIEKVFQNSPIPTSFAVAAASLTVVDTRDNITAANIMQLLSRLSQNSIHHTALQSATRPIARLVITLAGARSRSIAFESGIAVWAKLGLCDPATLRRLRASIPTDQGVAFTTAALRICAGDWGAEDILVGASMNAVGSVIGSVLRGLRASPDLVRRLVLSPIMLILIQRCVLGDIDIIRDTFGLVQSALELEPELRDRLVATVGTLCMVDADWAFYFGTDLRVRLLTGLVMEADGPCEARVRDICEFCGGRGLRKVLATRSREINLIRAVFQREVVANH
jgi:hypothetical protein